MDEHWTFVIINYTSFGISRVALALQTLYSAIELNACNTTAFE